MSQQPCPRCGGAGVTEKVEQTVERDENGNMVPKRHSYISQCTHCGGKGWVMGQ